MGRKALTLEILGWGAQNPRGESRRHSLHSASGWVALSTACVLTATGRSSVTAGSWRERTQRASRRHDLSDLLDRTSRSRWNASRRARRRCHRTEVDSAFAAARNMARALETIAADEVEGRSAARPLRRRQLNDCSCACSRAIRVSTAPTAPGCRARSAATTSTTSASRRSARTAPAAPCVDPRRARQDRPPALGRIRQPPAPHPT